MTQSVFHEFSKKVALRAGGAPQELLPEQPMTVAYGECCIGNQGTSVAVVLFEVAAT